MNHFTHPSFWKNDHDLPAEERKIADKNFALLKQNSQRPSMHFKKAGRYWSARVGVRYRAWRSKLTTASSGSRSRRARDTIKSSD
ncbi:MAG TPA: hypothetical protein VHC42_12810 [Rhizomicrobium sp.]|nr:hypothetical protein [Rhizomicrobium sp.]